MEKKKEKEKNTNRGTKKKGDTRKILDKGNPLMLLGI